MEVYLGGVQYPAFAETEGISYNVYFSGCSIRCEDCHNKHLWEKEKGYIQNVDDLVKHIHSVELITAVCILGGEPSEQPEALEELLVKLQDFPLKIHLYTGKEYEEVQHLAHLCDYIKCGRFDKNIPGKGRLASENQYIISTKRRNHLNAN